MKKIILIPAYQPNDRLCQLIGTIDSKVFDIIVVNDGSSKNYQKVFDKIQDKVYLLNYKENQGKGYALKYGLKYIKKNYSDNYLVVIMDSNGQYQIHDAIKLLNYNQNHLDTLVLGKRKRTVKIPLESQIGSVFMQVIYYLSTGIKIYDTQTGLRSFSNNLTDDLLKVEGNHYEYEMNMILNVSKSNYKIHEVEIDTIYFDDKKCLHFNVIKDSFLIYKNIIKFSFSSFVSFIIDYLLFTLLSFKINLIVSNVIARIFSATCNYIMNRNYVFKSKNKLGKTILLYSMLAISILVVNSLLLNILVNYLLLNKYLSKIIVEVISYFVSFNVQKKLIFKEEL